MVGVDISGRHEEHGAYLMVAAAVRAQVDAARIRSVDGMGFAVLAEPPDLEATLAVVAEATGDLAHPPEGPVVAEAGEFYEEPAEFVEPSFPTEFKYVETVAERQSVQAAHYAAYGARELLKSGGA
ncbi:MAG: uncharacterized protein conserved in archaea [Halorubrum sp. J07HR59]|nr:MAG: uncharacterized protein conserved in archaea [Halorubrum sp. J07HR59]